MPDRVRNHPSASLSAQRAPANLLRASGRGQGMPSEPALNDRPRGWRHSGSAGYGCARLLGRRCVHRTVHRPARCDLRHA